MAKLPRHLDPTEEDPTLDWDDANVENDDVGTTDNDRGRTRTDDPPREMFPPSRRRRSADEDDNDGGDDAMVQLVERPFAPEPVAAAETPPPAPVAASQAPVHVHLHPASGGGNGAVAATVSAEVKPKRSRTRRQAAEPPPPPAPAPSTTEPPSPPPRAHSDEGQSLYEWLRGFDLRPGIRYYTLTRLAPGEYLDSQGRMRPTAGVIEQDGTAPMTETGIRLKWGGQAWLVSVYQRGADGAERRLDTRQFVVASAPTAYLVGNTRVPLDPEHDEWTARTNPGANQRRGGRRQYSDEVIDEGGAEQFYDEGRSSWDGGGGSFEWSGGPGRRPSPFGRGYARSPLSDLAQQRAGEATDIIQAVSDTINRGQERADKLLHQTLGQLNDQVKAVQDKGDGPALQALTMLQDHMKSLAQRHEAVTESMRSAAAEQLGGLRTLMDNELRREREKTESERARWDREYKEAVDRRDRDYREALAAKDKEHQTEIARLGLQAAEDRRVADDRWKVILDAKERDLERMKSERDRDVERARADADRLLTDAKERHSESIRAIRDDAQRRGDDLQRSITDIKDRHAESMKQAREDADRRAAELQRHHDLMLETVRADRDKLRSELDHIRAENLGLRDKANPSVDAMLKQVGGIAEGLKSLGLVKGGGDDDGGFDPKRFLWERVGVAADNLSEALSKMATRPSPAAQAAAAQAAGPVWTPPPGYGYGPPQGPPPGYGPPPPQQQPRPMQAGPIQTAAPPQPPPAAPPQPQAQATTAETPPAETGGEEGATPEIDERVDAIIQSIPPEQAQQIAQVVAAVEQRRLEGVPAVAIAEFIAQNQPPEQLKDMAALDVEIAVQVGYDHGIETVGTPAARRFFAELHTALVAQAQARGLLVGGV